MADGFHQAGLLVHQALLHLEAGVAHLGDHRFARQIVMEMNGQLEIHFNMDQNIFKSQPVDFLVEGVFKKAASTHVEIMALRPVVHVIVRIEIAHADLDRTREHIL